MSFEIESEVKEVKIKMLDDFLGTCPKNEEVYKEFIVSKGPEVEQDEAEAMKGLEEKGWTGFMSDEKGLFIFNYMIKGFIKNAANVLKENADVKAFRSKIDDYLFVTPRKIYLGKEKPDGVLERPLRAMTAKGPRVSLARSDYISAGLELSFTVEVIKNKAFEIDDVMSLFKYGKYIGLGQWRNGGYGPFEVM